MNDADNIAKIRAGVEASIQAACAGILGKPNSREQVEEVILRTIRETVPEEFRGELEWTTRCSEERVLTITPRNLFTGLIMSGVPFKEARVHIGAKYAHLPHGSYLFTECGDFVFRPTAALEMITVTMDLGGSDADA